MNLNEQVTFIVDIAIHINKCKITSKPAEKRENQTGRRYRLYKHGKRRTSVYIKTKLQNGNTLVTEFYLGFLFFDLT